MLRGLLKAGLQPSAQAWPREGERGDRGTEGSSGQTPGFGSPKTSTEKDSGPGKRLLTLKGEFPFSPPPMSASLVAQTVKKPPIMRETSV